MFAVGWLLVHAGADVPVIDDWVYAWSVQHLLQTGRLQVLELSAFYPLAQIAWGALFARLLGFSFGVLRLSTLVLAVIGCWAIYLTLREFGCRRSTSLLGASALALDPVYFALSFSFMTEVPFVSASAMALYCYVRAFRRGQAAAIWAGSACAIAAFLVRPIGILLPLAILPALVLSRRLRLPLRSSLTPTLLTLAVMTILQVALPEVLGPLQWAAIREGYLQWWFTVPPATYLRWNLEVALVAVFPVVPLLVAYVDRRRRTIEVAAAAIVLAIVCRVALGAVPMPLLRGQTWSLQDIAARSMLDGTIALPPSAFILDPLVKAVGLVAAGALSVIGVRAWLRRTEILPGALVLLALAVLDVGAINILWLYNDRYYLILAPLLAIAGAATLDADRRGKLMATAVLILWAAVALTGTRDMLAFNEACANAAGELAASGIPLWDIDAGYAWNGWHLYAHPENLPPGANRRFDVPFVTSNRPTTYSITNSPLPHSRVIRVVPLASATWQATRALFVVRRP